MAFFSDMQAALDALRAVCGDDVDAVEIPAVVKRLADEGVVGVIQNATVLVRGAESVRIAASGAVASRSTRDGHDGLAQKRGHRSSVTLIQDLTGTSRSDAARQVRLGEALAAGLASTADGVDFGAIEADEGGTDASADAGEPRLGPSRPWHAALGDALMTGALTAAQHDAIFRGLGEPPAPTVEVTGERTPEEEPALAATAIAAWTAAAIQLIDESAGRTVEELASAARTIRDLLDPLGAQRRFEERFEGRSFRMWTDRDGTRRGAISFDDDRGAWVQTVIDAALRPRRGGPRFVDPDEAARAEQLADDPRSTRATPVRPSSPSTPPATRSTSAARRASTHRNSELPLPSATAAAERPAAAGQPHTARRTTSTPTPRAAAPTSIAAFCCAGSTTCNCITGAGTSLALERASSYSTSRAPLRPYR